MKSLNAKNTTFILLILLIGCISFACMSNNSNLSVAEVVLEPHEVPHDVVPSGNAYPTVSLDVIAEFAWDEFIALCYPADPNHRGQALVGSTFGDTTTEAIVWETYWHRVEMFPYNESPVNDSGSAKITGRPTYIYNPAAFIYNGHGTGDSTTWNNLDENNELNVDKMYSHEVSEENRILYEAKMNEDGFNYILKNKLYVGSTRDEFLNTTKEAANLKMYANKCGTTTANILCLPCGDTNGTEGNIEVKAAWKKLNHGEDVSKYYTNDVIRYQSVNNERKYFVEQYGLIGLHIIHKTESFPSYVFATFEHVDNDTAGISYIDEISQDNRGTGDVAGDTVLNVQRVHNVPSTIEKVNTTMQTTSPVSGTVFANYKLTGVQAYPTDYDSLDINNADDESIYYLANLAIESNQELQTFRGTKSADGDTLDNMYYEGQTINMGGCMGCHGVAQTDGSDFNFLIKNSPFTAPEVVGDEGIISLRDINSYQDVIDMFNDYVSLNGINITGSPHMAFWDSLSYTQFTTGNVPNVGIKICECGNSENSAIVQILEAAYDGISEMPLNGPYFPQEQIDKFATWIDNNCPE